MSRVPEVTHVDLYEEIVARIDDLEEDPDNVRLENHPETVEGLSRALEYFGRYDVAPRVWRTDDGKLRALAGSGRIRAAKKARQRNRDLQAIPVIRTAAPKDRQEKIFQQFSENALRDPLGPVDYGRGFKMLAGEGLSYAQMLEELSQRGILPKGRTKAWVSQMVQLAELEPEVQVLVNRGEVSVWQGLQLRQLPPEDQLAAAERARSQNLSRADVRQLVDGAARPPVEALLQETREAVQQTAAALDDDPVRRPGEADPARRNGAVERHWTLLSARCHAAPRSKVAALEKLDWYQGAVQEERDLAVEAVAGGHSPAAAVELVQRAVQEAPRVSQPLRELLISLGRLHQQVEDLASERSSAPAEFARLRLKSLLQVLRTQPG